MVSDLSFSELSQNCSEPLLFSILESMSDGVAIANRRGELIFLNPAAEDLFGPLVTSHSLIAGLNSSEVFLSDGKTPFPAEDSPLLRALRGESTNGVEQFIRSPRKPLGIFLVGTGRPLLNSQREIIGALAIFRDITEQKKSERLNRKKMESIGDLAGGMAHGFNNILSMIEVRCGEIQEQLDPHSPLQTSLEQIRHLNERGAHLTRRLLLFSRRRASQPRSVILNSALQDFQRKLPALLCEEIEVVAKIPSEAICVRIDPELLDHVLSDLVLNAEEAMPIGGMLTLELQSTTLTQGHHDRHFSIPPGKYAVLSIEDTGSGISEAALSHLFEPFYSTKVPSQGTGLGLATAHSVIKEAHGAIFVQNKAHQGARLEVYLPLISAPSPEARLHLPLSSPRDGLETVLLVEDEEELRTPLKALLARNGYHVLDARNGKEALDLIRECEKPIHLVITDVVMPVMNGTQFVENLRLHKPEIPILFLSGYTGESFQMLGESMKPCVTLLEKPFSTGAFLAKIRSILDVRE